ncbi:hypothetical protein V5799_005487 [Amblyomma americanum]|uniref:Uncharacterized protein n=1 Tax=Amblyomma americanum TaxID=6943 RepID=A0AAQ4DZ39_AMBAM
MDNMADVVMLAMEIVEDDESDDKFGSAFPFAAFGMRDFLSTLGDLPDYDDVGNDEDDGIISSSCCESQR